MNKQKQKINKTKPKLATMTEKEVFRFNTVL